MGAEWREIVIMVTHRSVGGVHDQRMEDEVGATKVEAKLPSRSVKFSRERALRFAIGLFRRKGYAGTSLEEITQRYGVSRQAFYYYYESKEDLLWDINQVAQNHLLSVADRLRHQKLDAYSHLSSLLEGYALVIAEHSENIACFFQDERNLSPKRRAEVGAVRHRFTNEVVRLYAAALADGRVIEIDPKLAAYLLLGSCNWISKWYQPKGAWSAEIVARTITQILIHGISTERLSASQRPGRATKARVSAPRRGRRPIEPARVTRHERGR